MPTVDVEENIKKLRVNIEQLTQEGFQASGYAPDLRGLQEGWADDD
jgi:hypothetical protein